MLVTVVVSLLVVWVVIGAVLALLIGRAAHVADERQRDAMLLGAARTKAPAARAAAAVREPVRI